MIPASKIEKVQPADAPTTRAAYRRLSDLIQTDIIERECAERYQTGMTQFFFNLHMCGEIIPDPEGMEFEDAVAAIKAATLEARGLLAAEVKAGKLCLGCHIQVVNGDTGEAVDVPFRSAVTITDG